MQSRLNQGVVGDFAGHDFFDVHGRIANTVMNDRVIGLGIDEFRPIAEVIAIAAETVNRLLFWVHCAPARLM